MLMKPEDLPTAEEAVISPALRKISGWREPQLDVRPPDAEETARFMREHGASNLRTIIDTAKKMVAAEPPRPDKGASS